MRAAGIPSWRDLITHFADRPPLAYKLELLCLAVVPVREGGGAMPLGLQGRPAWPVEFCSGMPGFFLYQ